LWAASTLPRSAVTRGNDGGQCHGDVAEVAAGDDWWDSPNDLLDNQTPTAVLHDADVIDTAAAADLDV
jgi:hypothetical protein